MLFRNQATKHDLCPKPEVSQLARRDNVMDGKLDACCGDAVYKFPYASAGNVTILLFFRIDKDFPYFL